MIQRKNFPVRVKFGSVSVEATLDKPTDLPPSIEAEMLRTDPKNWERIDNDPAPVVTPDPVSESRTTKGKKERK